MLHLLLVCVLAMCFCIPVRAFLGSDRGSEVLAAMRSDDPIPYLSPPSVPPPQFGHDMLPLFAMAPGFVNFNAGSFGGQRRRRRRRTGSELLCVRGLLTRADLVTGILAHSHSLTRSLTYSLSHSLSLSLYLSIYLSIWL
jgi:hypothetical protein